MHLFLIMSNFCSKWWVKCGNFKIVENNRLSWQRGRHLDRSLTWAASEYPSTDTSRDPFIPKDSWKRFKARQLDTVKNFIKLITLLETCRVCISRPQNFQTLIFLNRNFKPEFLNPKIFKPWFLYPKIFKPQFLTRKIFKPEFYSVEILNPKIFKPLNFQKTSLRTKPQPL